MQKVFISYSHDDADFADRLILDLRAFDVPATYDKWLLRVGDSIIQKIAAEVSEAGNVIALLSPVSVESNWVKKELALAMTGELQRTGVKVLPAVIADCKLPPMLADKLYADFRHNYYFGLRRLLQALIPSSYEDEKFIREEQIESARRELVELLARGDRDKVNAWLVANGFALAALCGELMRVSESIPRFSVDNQVVDFLVVSGQSEQYDLSLIVLGDVNLRSDFDRVSTKETVRLQPMVYWCNDNTDIVTHALAGRMASSYGAEQIATLTSHGYKPRIDAKVLLGRRSDYREQDNELCRRIYEATGRAVDVISYDRILDAVDRILRQRR